MRASDIPTFDTFVTGTIALTKAVTQGPNVSGGICTFQTAKSSETLTVNLCSDSTGTGGEQITGGSPINQKLLNNLNLIWFNANGSVTINYSVQR